MGKGIEPAEFLRLLSACHVISHPIDLSANKLSIKVLHRYNLGRHITLESNL